MAHCIEFDGCVCDCRSLGVYLCVRFDVKLIMTAHDYEYYLVFKIGNESECIIYYVDV